MLEKITLLVSVMINASAVIVGVALEKNRRHLDANRARIADRRTIYSSFMAKIVRWQHLVVIEYESRNERDRPSGRTQAEVFDSLRIARQDAMEPLFELRMLGSPELARLAEEVVNFNYRYEDEYRTSTVPLPSPHPDWIRVRDDFISAARREFGADTA